MQITEFFHEVLQIIDFLHEFLLNIDFFLKLGTLCKLQKVSWLSKFRGYIVLKFRKFEPTVSDSGLVKSKLRILSCEMLLFKMYI